MTLQRANFQTQILEKLGAPLVAAVRDVAARAPQEQDPENIPQQAGQVAELLNRAVQLGVGVYDSMNVKADGSDADAVRLALTALAGSMTAAQYKAAGKMPTENDIKRLIKMLEAVLTFSDSFAPTPENTARLQNIASGGMAADENQVGIQYVGALTPVINAIAAFSFGRPEGKLAQEVAGRLVEKAESITSPPAALGALKALAVLYVSCHEQETARIMAMDEVARASAAEAAGGLLPMDGVWHAFEVRASMAGLIAQSAAPQSGQVGGGEAVAPAPIPEAPLPQQQNADVPPEPPSRPVESVPPAAPPVSDPPAQGDVPAQQEGYNPMGFFKPKTQDDSSGGNDGGAS